VLLGVNATGSNTVNTTGNGVHGNPSNDAGSFLGLEVTSNSGGGVVFQDKVILQYSSGINDDLSCGSTNTTPAPVGNGFLGAATVSCGASSASGGINETGSYMIVTNQVYDVTLQTDINVGTANDGNASGAGTVEGMVTMDPTFTVPAGYTIILSAGIGNTPAASGVPEPATWSMLAAGMGLLVLAKRRVSRANRGGAPAR
jgi:hypothetical protein